MGPIYQAICPCSMDHGTLGGVINYGWCERARRGGVNFQSRDGGWQFHAQLLRGNVVHFGLPLKILIFRVCMIIEEGRFSVWAIFKFQIAPTRKLMTTSLFSGSVFLRFDRKAFPDWAPLYGSIKGIKSTSNVGSTYFELRIWNDDLVMGVSGWLSLEAQTKV